MRFGYCIPNNQGVDDVRDLVRLGQEAETLGFHSLWVSEHLFHASYVAKRLGNRPYHDALTVLTALAGATSSARLGTSVLVLPWHHPARLGKTIASLDQLSGGRVDLGVGVAVTEDEFANLGVDFASRGRRTDEILAALQALWTQPMPAFTGEFYQFSGLAFEPKPRQQPYPPIHIGGGSSAALRRVARFGNGWHALGQSPADLSANVTRLRGMVAAAGRNPDDLHISIRTVLRFADEPWERPVQDRVTLKGTDAELRAMLQAYANAGVDEIVVDPASPDSDENSAALRRFAALAF